MKSILFIMCLPFLFASEQLTSTERVSPFFPTQDLPVLPKGYGLAYTELPKNPVLRQASFIFLDKELQTKANLLKANTPLSIQSLELNQTGDFIFRLSDQTYIAADRQVIYDDVVLEEEALKETYWTKEVQEVYQEPYVLGTKTASKKPESYKPVTVIKRARTHTGVYFELEDYGWLSQKDLSKEDTRMEGVQKLLDNHYNKADYGISIKQLATQKTAGINADKPMYAASLAKLPTLYMTQMALDNKEITLETPYLYQEQVHDFNGAYDPSGSGHLPKIADDEPYLVEDLLRALAKSSDNVASNILAYYAAHQFNEQVLADLKGLTDWDWDMKTRQIPPLAITKLLEALYYQNGIVLDYLSETDFDDDRISKNISDRVAHKIGDAYDFKHDAAVIYSDSPFIMTIMTNQASYDTISEIADEVYRILK